MHMHIYFTIFQNIYGPMSQRDFHGYFFKYSMLQWIASGKPTNMDLDSSIHFIWVASMDCIWQTHQCGFGWSNAFIWVASMDCIWQTHQCGFGWSNSFIWVASMDCIWQTHQRGFGWFNPFYMGEKFKVILACLILSINCSICSFDLILYVLWVNNFPVMLRRVFLGWTSTIKAGINVSCSRTQRSAYGEDILHMGQTQN